MRKLGAIGFAALALLGACGGGSKDKTNDAVQDGAGALSKLAANSAAADVCGGREAVNVGLAFQSALTNAGQVDYKDVAAALQKAADAAPSEIKDDFRVIADAEGPFLKILSETDMSNYMALSQNTEFQAAIAKLGETDFKTASENINTWFTEHCK
jgi:hypothetical protein